MKARLGEALTPPDVLAHGTRPGQQGLEVPFIVRMACEKAVSWNWPVYMVKLDVLTAFDRLLPQSWVSVLLSIAREFPQHQSNVAVLIRLNTGLELVPRIGGFEATHGVLQCRGLLQGLPESGHLFALTLSRALSVLREHPDALEMGGVCLAAPRYVDDVYLLSPSLPGALNMADACTNRLAQLGLAPSPEKCEISCTHAALEGVIRTPRGLPLRATSRITVVGVPVIPSAPNSWAMLWQDFISRAWACFWSLSCLLCCGRLPLRARLPLLFRTVGNSVLWAAGALSSDATIGEKLRTTQQWMVIRMARWKRRPGEAYVTWHRRCHRRARGLIPSAHRWDTLALDRQLRFGGHLARARGDRHLATQLLDVRSLGWWRRQQQELPAHRRTRHALGGAVAWAHRWEANLENAMEWARTDPALAGAIRETAALHLTDWRQLAIHRDLWREICSAYVARTS